MSDRLPSALKQAQQSDAEDFLQRCSEVEVHDLPITFSSQSPTVTLPACLTRFVSLSVLLRLDKPNKWQAALEADWIPSPLLEWLGKRTLEDLSEAGTALGSDRN